MDDPVIQIIQKFKSYFNIKNDYISEAKFFFPFKSVFSNDLQRPIEN